MDSKQFCQLLFAKGIESGMSIEEIDRKMNASYGRSFVKDLECGTRKFTMDSIMKYIDIIGLNLVIIDSHSVNAASNYDQLMELCSKKCRHFPFRKGRVDAYGVRSWVPSSKWEVVNDWLYLSGFLLRMGKFGYEIDVMNDEQIEAMRAKIAILELERKKRRKRYLWIFNILAVFFSLCALLLIFMIPDDTILWGYLIVLGITAVILMNFIPEDTLVTVIAIAAMIGWLAGASVLKVILGIIVTLVILLCANSQANKKIW